MILELIILALILNSAHAAALNKRGFALGSYHPNTRLTNGPATGLSRSVWSDQLNQRYKKYDQQRPKTALSYAYDQFDAQHNENILRSLSTLKRHSYPIVVDVDGASRRFLIVRRIYGNSLANAFEAYLMHDKFVSSIPLVLMAFVNDNGDADQNLSKELTFRAELKEENLVVDRAHSILIYGGDWDSSHTVFQGNGLQPLLTNSHLQELKPIIFESIRTALANLDLQSTYLVRAPLLPPIGLNLTYFYIDENEVQWHPSADIMFIQDAMRVDIGISFKVYTKYQTNSRLILPSATTNATVENLRFISDVGFNLINGTLFPDFKTLNITIENLHVSSSTSSILFIASFFKGLILSQSSAAIRSILKNLFVGTVSQILQSEIYIKNLGAFKPVFLKDPEISRHGMLVDMTVVKVD